MMMIIDDCEHIDDHQGRYICYDDHFFFWLRPFNDYKRKYLSKFLTNDNHTKKSLVMTWSFPIEIFKICHLLSNRYRLRWIQVFFICSMNENDLAKLTQTLSDC